MHVYWGHAAAHQLGRVLEDPDRGTMGLANLADEALEQCGVCRAFNMAPHIPIVGSSVVSPFNVKLRVDLLFSDDAIALHAMEMPAR